MVQKSNSLERFWKELKRRKVVHVITVYVALAFGILQLVDIIGPSLKWADWTMTFVIVLLCIGFVISVFISWIYDITPAGVKKTKPVSAVKHTDQTATTTSSGWKIATYVSAVIIIALVAFNFISKWRLNADITKLEKSIAVLPFINDSPSDSNQYFINGIMEEVLNNLQKIKDFRVLSRTSTDQYKSTDRPTIPEIAKKLGVSYIVEGSGQKYGNRFRLRVQLIKVTRKENHLWANSYEKELKATSDLFSMQSEIAVSIATELKASITPEEKQLIEIVPTSNLTAYDFFQRGKEEHLKYWLDNSNLRALKEAETYYKKALEYDSTFALAYAGLALFQKDRLFEKYTSQIVSKKDKDSLLILANKAVSYDEKVAGAYFARGYYYFLNNNIDQCEKDFDKALKYNPNYWSVYSSKGWFIYLGYSNKIDFIKALECQLKAIDLNRGKELPGLLRRMGDIYGSYGGFHDKAVNCYKEAFKLDNDSLEYFKKLAGEQYACGNYAKAAEIYKNALVNDSTDMDIVLGLGQQYMYLNHYKESLYYFRKYIEYFKQTGRLKETSFHRFGYIYWKNGYNKEANYWLNKQKAILEVSIKDRSNPFLMNAYYDLAGICAFMGEKNKAYENLRLLNQIKVFPRMWLTLIKIDPLLDNLRNEPEFQKIVSELEAKYQAEHERVKKWLEKQGML
jgi:TolB-like protein/Tfp pilus assembly protein PilF